MIKYLSIISVTVGLLITTSCDTTKLATDKQGIAVVVTTKGGGFGVKVGADWKLIGEEAEQFLPEDVNELIHEYNDKKDGSLLFSDEVEEFIENREEEIMPPQDERLIIIPK